jgi:hypothetical protein
VGQSHKGHGEWKKTPRFRSVTLSSTNRTKRGDLGRQPGHGATPPPGFAVNEALLPLGLLTLGLLTANLLPSASTLMAAATGPLWSRLTCRNRALNVPGCFTQIARYVQVHIHEAYVAIWQSTHEQLDHLLSG